MSAARRRAISSLLNRFNIVPTRSAGKFRVLDAHDAIDEDSGRDDGLGIEFAQFDEFAHLHDGGAGGHAHDRAEIALGLPVHEVAPAVGTLRLHEREIPPYGLLEHIVPAVDLARFLAL